MTTKKSSNIDNETAWHPATDITPPVKSRPVRKLTRKQQAFVQYLVDNPKASGSEAVHNSYGKEGEVLDDNTARAIASENLTKPNIIAELAKYSHSAEVVLVEVMQTANKHSKSGTTAGASYASVAEKTANSILDRLHGKAVQRSVNANVAVTLNVDLTGNA